MALSCRLVSSSDGPDEMVASRQEKLTVRASVPRCRISRPGRLVTEGVLTSDRCAHKVTLSSPNCEPLDWPMILHAYTADVIGTH